MNSTAATEWIPFVDGWVHNLSLSQSISCSEQVTQCRSKEHGKAFTYCANHFTLSHDIFLPFQHPADVQLCIGWTGRVPPHPSPQSTFSTGSLLGTLSCLNPGWEVVLGKLIGGLNACHIFPEEDKRELNFEESSACVFVSYQPNSTLTKFVET